MTIPIWPSDLPRPRRDGYGSVLPDGRSSTQPEAGPPRVRRRFSAAVATRQLTIDVDADGRMRFWRFWREDTVGGSLPFWIPDWTLEGLPIGDEAGTALATETGMPITIATRDLVLFATSQPPSEAPIGVRWRISLQLSVMP